MAFITNNLSIRLLGSMVQDLSLYGKSQTYSHKLNTADFQTKDMKRLISLIEKEYARKQVNKLTEEIVLREYPDFDMLMFQALPTDDPENQMYVAMDEYQRVKQREVFSNMFYSFAQLQAELDSLGDQITIERYDEIREEMQKMFRNTRPIHQQVDLRPAYIKESISEYQDPEKYNRIPTYFGNFQTKEEGVLINENFDEILSGGLYRREHHLLAGSSGTGKTSTACQMAVKQAYKYQQNGGYRVCYLTLEQSEDNIRDKMLGIIRRSSFVEMQNRRQTKTFEEFESNREENARIFDLYFGDNLTVTYCHPSAAEFRTILSQLVDLYDIIYVDNINNIDYSGFKESEEIGRLSNDCSKILKDSNCALVFLTQVTPNQQEWSKTKPFNSSRLLQDTSTFILLYREEDKYPPKQKKGDEEEIQIKKTPRTYVDVLKKRQSSSGETYYDCVFPYDPRASRLGVFFMPSVNEVKELRLKEQKAKKEKALKLSRMIKDNNLTEDAFQEFR
jgi:KaiC/GvpD/RAD55 family RecA-like ATPase